jgi:hypothetical protein
VAMVYIYTQYSIHIHKIQYTFTHNTQDGTYKTITKEKTLEREKTIEEKVKGNKNKENTIIIEQ